jgi:nucleotide-binding universal stress UspA family protein
MGMMAEAEALHASIGGGVAKRPVIVCPVDSTPGAQTTAAYALELARPLEADVHLLHVAPVARPTRPELEGTDWQDGRVTDWSRLMELARAAFSDGSRVRLVTHKGSATSIIPAYAHLTAANLVVVERDYGTSRWWRNASVARRLRWSSPCPVLVLPPSQTNTAASCEEILCAIDWTVASALALRTALDWAQRREAHLTLVHVLEIPRDLLFSGPEALNLAERAQGQAAAAAERLRRRVSSEALRGVDVRFLTGAPNRRILDVAAEVNADLLVVGVAPRGALDEAFAPSTSGTVLRHATRPILFVPVPAGAHEWLEEPSSVAGDTIVH